MGVADSESANESNVFNSVGPRRKAIYCDDCGREKLAEIRNGKLIIMDRRHGKRHIAVLPAPDESN